MIENKNTYLEYVRNSQEILGGLTYESIKPQAEKLSALQKFLEDTELIIQLFGSYSTGKNILINSFLSEVKQNIRKEIFKDITIEVDRAIHHELDNFELGPDFVDKVKTGWKM